VGSSTKDRTSSARSRRGPPDRVPSSPWAARDRVAVGVLSSRSERRESRSDHEKSRSRPAAPDRLPGADTGDRSPSCGGAPGPVSSRARWSPERASLVPHPPDDCAQRRRRVGDDWRVHAQSYHLDCLDALFELHSVPPRRWRIYHRIHCRLTQAAGDIFRLGRWERRATPRVGHALSLVGSGRSVSRHRPEARLGCPRMNPSSSKTGPPLPGDAAGPAGAARTEEFFAFLRDFLQEFPSTGTR